MHHKDKIVSRDENWITVHFQELVEHYGGKYVGIAHCRVIAGGDGAGESPRRPEPWLSINVCIL